MPATKKELAEQELQRRNEQAIKDALARFTAKAYSTTKLGISHAGQLRLLLSTAARVLVACTPRAGKTRAILWILATAALLTANVSCLYIGITAEQASRIAWRPWKRMLLEYKIPHEHREGQMATTFPNGSVVYFSGAQDVGDGTVFLGDSYAGGVVVLDECQDRPDAVLVPLIEDILEERLSDITDEHPNVGRLIAIGSMPKGPGGWFWRQIMDPDESQKWEHHGWSRLENPFLKDQKAQLQDFCQKRKLTIDDELVQRNWFAKKIWTKTGGRPYVYSKERNGYEPTRPPWADSIVTRSGSIFASNPWPGVTDYACAIDLGGSDRASIQCVGWGKDVEVVQHVFDWTSDRDAHYAWGELLPILGAVRDHYVNVVAWVYDSDASKTEHDTLGREYGIPLIAAAKKQFMVEQVRRVTDLLRRGKLKIMIGSHVEDDFTRAMWDQRELAKGKWKLAEGPNKVDASEAYRYAIAEWFDVSNGQKPTPKDPVQILLQQEPLPTVDYGPKSDPDMDRFFGGPSDRYGGPDRDH